MRENRSKQSMHRGAYIGHLLVMLFLLPSRLTWRRREAELRTQNSSTLNLHLHLFVLKKQDAYIAV